MTLDNLERQNRGFYRFISRYRASQVFIIHKKAPPSPMPHAPMADVYYGPDGPSPSDINYNYWTGNAIGFRASRELCSNFLFDSGSMAHKTQEHIYRNAKLKKEEKKKMKKRCV